MPEPTPAPSSAPAKKQPAPLSRTELIVLVAGLMASNALSIDVMLPALPNIGASFGVARENDRQLVIVTFVVASGAAQLFHGPLVDSLGRRRVILGGLIGYMAGVISCMLAWDFRLFLAARVLQGICAAATRVAAVALVRDLVSGAQMAKLMASAMMIFMIVPIIGPAVGQGILALAPWRWIFGLLLVIAVAIFALAYFRTPETMAAARKPLNMRAAIEAYVIVCRNRTLMGYCLAQTLMFAGLFALIASSQQLFADLFKTGPYFAVAFGSFGAVLLLSQFSNSRLVMRVGLRRLSHGAAIAYAVMATIHALIGTVVNESIWLFMGLLLPTMYTFSFAGPNYNAIAMEPMAENAGAAAAFIGFMTTVGGAVFGGLVGQAFDGTVHPLLYGQALFAISALAIVAITERGALFGRPRKAWAGPS